MKTYFIKSIFSFCLLFSLYILRINAQPFVTEWEKTFGGSGVDFNDYIGNTLAKTPDGGFAFTAMTYSNDGDVSGNHGGIDAWVVKLNSAGNIQWQKCLGGSADDHAQNLIVSSDGGVLVGGWTNSNDGNITGNHGGNDIFIVKLSSAGNLEWEKTLGSNKDEDCFSFIQDNNGNYLVAGLTSGNNGDVSGNHGKYDAWVVKLNPSGNIIWQQCYGGSQDEGLPFRHGTSICKSAEGGYLLATTTASNNGQVSGFHAGPNGWIVDAWLVKLDVQGNIEWQNCYGTAANDFFENIMQTSSGDYIGSGLINPRSEKEANLTYGGNGDYDWWICRITSSGTPLWSKQYGGTGPEAVHNEILELPNGDLIAPSGNRSNDFDCVGGTISATNPTDIWILKLDAGGNVLGSQIWNRPGYQNLSAAILNPDGSIVVAALTDSLNYTGHGFNSDNTSASQIWIFKLQPNPADVFAISTTSLSGDQYCPGNSPFGISVSYETRGNFQPGNIFTAQLSDANSGFSSPVIIGTVNSTSPGTISCIIPGNLPMGNYYAIRVTSSNPAFTGITSGKYFSIQCTAPDPNEATGVTATSASFSWSECLNSNKNQLKYRALNSNNWISLNTDNSNTVIHSLLPSTTYVWAVRTKCLDSPLTWSDWSVSKTFTTASLRLAGNRDKSIDFQVFPNPVTNSGTISFFLSQPGKVSFKLFEMSGRLVSIPLTGTEKHFDVGENELIWSTENVSAGVYFLELQSEEKVQVKKIIVSK